MKIHKTIFVLTLVYFFSQLFIFPQEQRGLGLILDDPSIDLIPRAPNLMRGDYNNLPQRVSLKEYAPTPGNQLGTSTCVGWAVGYSARTILHSISNNLVGKSIIDSNTFSPSYIYNKIRYASGCDGGANLYDALLLVKEEGILPYNKFGFDCDKNVSFEDSIKASKYKILEYRTVASRGDDKTIFVKKSLAEGKPVVIAMDVPGSFFTTGEFWRPDSTEYQRFNRGHALTVIGYDDLKNGGAFEVMNSWGNKIWGDSGFTWIAYSDFDYFCDVAVEVLEKPIPLGEGFDYSGSLKFVLSDDFPIQLKRSGDYYQTVEEFSEGTLFRLVISNNQPAYVYAFATDLSYEVTQIFPPNKKVSPYLPYRGNNISIPDEDSFHYLENGIGNTFYCFLYSDEMLDIEKIIQGIKNSNGEFSERVNNVLKNDRINDKDVLISTEGGLSFQAIKKNSKVLPILIEIIHISKD